ncbi:unnamed protein product, partial [marine sediment metagenome]
AIVLIGSYIRKTNKARNFSGDIISGDITIGSKLIHEIHIDCEWVKDHQNDITINFVNGTVELCKQAFPELWETVPLNVTITWSPMDVL